MVRPLILSFALLLHLIDTVVLGELALATVDGDVKLTPSKNCPDSHVLELTTGKEPVKTLAQRVNGSWAEVPGGPFSRRVVHNSRSSLSLTNLNFKDNLHVVFVCNGEDFNTVDLKVLPCNNTTVTDGDTAVLMCYSSAHQVKWTKEGGEIRVGNVSYREDEASPGRFLMIMWEVRQEDQGVYFCDTLMAFRLIVNPRLNQTTSSPSPHCDTTQSPSEGNEMRPREIISWVLVGVLSAVVIIGLVILLYQQKKKCCSDASAERGEQTEMKWLRGQNNHTDSHANNHNSH